MYIGNDTGLSPEGETCLMCPHNIHSTLLGKGFHLIAMDERGKITATRGLVDSFLTTKPPKLEECPPSVISSFFFNSKDKINYAQSKISIFCFLKLQFPKFCWCRSKLCSVIKSANELKSGQNVHMVTLLI